MYCRRDLSLHLVEVLAMAGEVRLRRLPGNPSITLTRSEAIELANGLIAQLKLSEPYIPRLSLWRRLKDSWRRWRMSDGELASRRARAEALLNANVRR